MKSYFWSFVLAWLACMQDFNPLDTNGADIANRMTFAIYRDIRVLRMFCEASENASAFCFITFEVLAITITINASQHNHTKYQSIKSDAEIKIALREPSSRSYYYLSTRYPNPQAPSRHHPRLCHLYSHPLHPPFTHKPFMSL
jgi:hypothetical protein